MHRPVGLWDATTHRRASPALLGVFVRKASSEPLAAQATEHDIQIVDHLSEAGNLGTIDQPLALGRQSLLDHAIQQHDFMVYSGTDRRVCAEQRRTGFRPLLSSAPGVKTRSLKAADCRDP